MSGKNIFAFRGVIGPRLQPREDNSICNEAIAELTWSDLQKYAGGMGIHISRDQANAVIQDEMQHIEGAMQMAGLDYAVGVARDRYENVLPPTA